MKGRDIYKIWAPNGAKWVEWIRPVPFVAIDSDINKSEYCDFTISDIMFLKEKPKSTAIIVDLLSDYSIEMGIALTEFGFRPIPIFNGTIEQEGSIPTTNNHIVENALVWGALKLENIKLSKDALPAFLLDSARTNTYKMNESVFDNSWDIYAQDIPSIEYFEKNGINKIIVIGDSVQRDLRKILFKFQKRNIRIFWTNGYCEPKEVKLKIPFIERFIKEV